MYYHYLIDGMNLPTAEARSRGRVSPGPSLSSYSSTSSSQSSSSVPGPRPELHVARPQQETHVRGVEWDDIIERDRVRAQQRQKAQPPTLYGK